MSFVGTAIISTAANIVSEPIKKGILDIYESLKTKSIISVEKWRAERGIEDLATQVRNIRNVKTIWQIDRPVDLKDFYVPPHIRVGDERIKVSSIDDLPKTDCILIEGIAGQGKSMLLRYLCSQELLEGSRIPIFIELRKIKNNESIYHYISKYFDILGLQLCRQAFTELLREGRLSIYLDGFDEITPEISDQIVEEIEHLCLSQKNSKIIITSRPFQTIRSLPILDVVQLDKLIKLEYKEVVYKISESRDYAEALIKTVDSHIHDIKGILCTPLFVTLLVISYKSYQQIPEQLSDFYDSLFRVLLQRHDGTKPAYVRTRKTKLNDTKFRDGFELFCYLSKKHKKNSLTSDEALFTAHEALTKKSISAEPIDFINDISNVTCLIINEGDEWRYIHKSIQEYFTASHIRNMPEVKAQKIYSELSKRFRQDWATELTFLSEIDEYRYAKYFFIPCVKKIIGNPSNFDGTPPKVNISQVKAILGSYKIKLSSTDNQIIKVTIYFDDTIVSPLHEIVFSCTAFLMRQFANIKRDVLTTEEKFGELDLTKIISNSRTKADAFRFVESLIAQLYERGRAYETMIKSTEQEVIDEDLFN